MNNTFLAPTIISPAHTQRETLRSSGVNKLAPLQRCYLLSFMQKKVDQGHNESKSNNLEAAAKKVDVQSCSVCIVGRCALWYGSRYLGPRLTQS